MPFLKHSPGSQDYKPIDVDGRWIPTCDLFFFHFAASTISAEDCPEPSYGEEIISAAKELMLSVAL